MGLGAHGIIIIIIIIHQSYYILHPSIIINHIYSRNCLQVIYKIQITFKIFFTKSFHNELPPPSFIIIIIIIIFFFFIKPLTHKFSALPPTSPFTKHLSCRMEDEPLPEDCAVKVFKTTLTDFKTRERYIKEDFRFKDRLSKNNSQKVGLNEADGC